MGKRHRAEATQHTKHHADEHIRDKTGRIHDPGSGLTNHDDATFDHTQGGTSKWAEAPASYLPPPETLETLHGFAARLDHARRICLSFVGPRKAPNWVKAILRVPTDDVTPERPDVLYFDAKLALDTDAASGLKAGETTHQKKTSYWDQDNYFIDANKIPYFVLPKYPGDFWWTFGIRPFDIAAIIFKTRVVYAVFADQGPPDQLGEASIEVHRLLGLERVHDGHVTDRSFSTGTGKKEVEEFVQTIVFPGSGNQSQTEPSIIRARGHELFIQVGGAPVDEHPDATKH
jgi:Fungal chitosanase of glycosyl hydrolase group 75